MQWMKSKIHILEGNSRTPAAETKDVAIIGALLTQASFQEARLKAPRQPSAIVCGDHRSHEKLLSTTQLVSGGHLPHRLSLQRIQKAGG